MSSNSLVGCAGAYYVAAELSQLGFIATVTSRNTDNVDVLASSADGLKTVSIQVKASSPDQRKNYDRSWWMNKKHENVFSDSFFYVFVDLKPSQEKPDFYIVPSRTVANYIKTAHKKYLRTPGRNGKPHKDIDARFFEIEDENTAKKYRNEWCNLGLGTVSLTQ